MTYLRAGPGGPRCRLGAVMTDLKGISYALSARYVLERSRDGQIYDDQGVVVGSFARDGLAWHDESSVAHPYHELIGRIVLGAGVVPPDGLAAACRQGVFDAPIRPGGTLTWYSTGGELVDFRVVGRGGEVGFTNPFNGHTSYHSDPIVLELTNEARGARPGAGDAGSLLCDSSSAAVALLLSFDGKRYYAASIAAYATRFQLHPFFQQPLLAPPVRHEPMSLPAAVAEAREAVNHVCMVVAAKPAVHLSPDGENVPPHLIGQLDEVPA